MKTTKYLFFVLVFPFLFSNCKKEEDKYIPSVVEGDWRFNRYNLIFYWDNIVYDCEAEEDTEILGYFDSFNTLFKGVTFSFYGDIATVKGRGGEQDSGQFRISASTITLPGWPTIKYRIEGDFLLLILDTGAIEEELGGGAPDAFYEFDNVELVLYFMRI